MSLLDDIQAMKDAALEKLAAAKDAPALDAWRSAYLGAKGAVKSVMDRLKEAPKAEKPRLAKAANEVKNALQAAYDAIAQRLAPTGPKSSGPKNDVTLPVLP